MTPDERRVRRENTRMWTGMLMILAGFLGAIVGAIVGNVAWLSLLLLIPLAAMLVAWAEDCPSCGGPLRPAAGWDERGREICRRCARR